MNLFASLILNYLSGLFELFINPILNYLSTAYRPTIPKESRGDIVENHTWELWGIWGNWGSWGIFGKIGRDGDYGNFGNYGMGLEEGDYLGMGRESQRETISRVAASRGGTISGMRHSISGAVFFSSWLSSGVMKVQSTG